MNNHLFEIVTYFILYSFLGWVMESIYRSCCERKLINTGFLRGPFCPIYGIGAIMMFLLLEGFENQPIFLFIVAIVVLTIWEYAVGVFLETAFDTKYWDYSDHKFNFQGRICLTNSIYWGILGVVFIKYIHPLMQKMVAKVDIRIWYVVITILGIVFIVDSIVSIIKVKNIKSTLEKIENINKEIKEKLKELKNNKIEKGTTTEHIQNIIEELKHKRNKTILRLYKNVYRLKRAFPAINTKEITQILNEKIEDRKKKVKNKQKT